MTLLDILSSLMMDDTYKGRGKYHSQVSRPRGVTAAAPGPLEGVLDTHPPPPPPLHPPPASRSPAGGARSPAPPPPHPPPPQTSSRALEQETRERATVLQTEFENFVHASVGSVRAARTGELQPPRAHL